MQYLISKIKNLSYLFIYYCPKRWLNLSGMIALDLLTVMKVPGLMESNLTPVKCKTTLERFLGFAHPLRILMFFQAHVGSQECFLALQLQLFSDDVKLSLRTP